MHRAMLVLLSVASVTAHAQSPAAARGELLYTTHCQACHTTHVHWREKRIANDWAGLVVQVERWQKNGNLAWGAEDIDDVSRYLNARYYHFAEPEGQPASAQPRAPRPLGGCGSAGT